MTKRRFRHLARGAWMLPALALAACAVGGQIGTEGQRILPAMPGVDQGQAEQLAAAGAPRIELTLVDQGMTALLVKTGQQGDVTRWRTIDNTQVYTRDGLVIGTRGLSFDLITAETGEAAEAILGQRSARITRFHTYLDGDDRTKMRAYVCDIVPAGPEAARLPDGRVVTGRLVREECHNPEMDFTNLYVLSNGRVLKTLQFISARAGRAQILFPPA